MKLTKTFFDDIRGLISSARATVARGVDLVQVYTNFEIGRRIVVQEQKGKGRAVYGKEVIRELAARLVDEFGKGYSKTNLEYMRRFYLENAGRLPISQSMTGQLGSPGKSQALSGQFDPLQIAQSATGQSEILQTPSAKSPSGQIHLSPADETPSPRPFTLSWTHYIFLLGVKNPDERSFYEIESAAQDAESTEVLETIRRLLA